MFIIGLTILVYLFVVSLQGGQLGQRELWQWTDENCDNCDNEQIFRHLWL